MTIFNHSNALVHLEKKVFELNNYQELKKIFHWTQDPILDRPDIHDFDYIEDINERRIRDSESIATVVKNAIPNVALEIGTANGMGTVLMSVNAPQAKLYTINIPPEQIQSGEGGVLTTVAMARDSIGIEYKKRNLTNIIQILENTKYWIPNIGTIEVAFIDGCHDTEFVFNDTVKVLKHMKPGGFILWHDFNLELRYKFPWINDVVKGVEKLYKKGYLHNNMYHIRDSWVGIYCV